MSLHHLVRAVRSGDFPERAVAITLDDGYADNLHTAKPLFQRFAVPATVFVTTGHVGSEREFWSDELERLLFQPENLPAMLHLNINGHTRRWELGEAAYSCDRDSRHQCWHVHVEEEPGTRYSLYRTLYQLLRPLPAREQRRIVDELLAWAQLEPLLRPTHRVLSADEIVQLAEGGLIAVGAHSVTHPVLSQFPAENQRYEIAGSKKCLEEILGQPVICFAYPYGARSHYTKTTVAIVQEAGFHFACSSLADIVWQGSNWFQIPRMFVEDWDGSEFAYRLRQWFDDQVVLT